MACNTVLFVFDTLIYGGIERIGIEYVKIFKDLGYKVEIIVLNPKTDDIIEEYKEMCTVKKMFYPRYFSPYFVYKLIEKNIVFSFLLPIVIPIMVIINLVYLVLFKVIFRKKYDCSIAFSGHLNDLFFTSFIVKSSRKIAWLHGNHISYSLLSRAYDELYKHFDKLVKLSDNGDDVFNHIFSEYVKNDIVIHNPVEIDFSSVSYSHVSELKKDYGDDYVLTVARMDKDKDYLTLIRAIRILKDKGIRNKFLFIGDGADRANLERISVDLHVDDMIVFEGKKSNVYDYFAGAKMFVHSSPSEGLPTTLIEAIAFEVPIVATDSYPGVREILTDDQSGIIVPVGDEESLAESIFLILNDDELASRLSANAYHHLARFSRENAYDGIKNSVMEWV